MVLPSLVLLQAVYLAGIVEVNKITGDVVKEATGLMKTGKADVSEGFSSDAILNGPEPLCDQLAMVFRSWCVHGTVTYSLLACAFLHLLKSALKDPADPGSYRDIAGSSIVLKLFDKVVLLLRYITMQRACSGGC